MVDRNHTSELLAAAENRNQLRPSWPSDLIPGSVLKADPSMGGRWCPWNSKNRQEQPPPRFAIGMQNVTSATFRTTRSTRLFAQMMRRADCQNSDLGLSRAFKSRPAGQTRQLRSSCVDFTNSSRCASCSSMYLFYVEILITSCRTT